MSVRPVSLIVSGATLAASAPLLTERILPASLEAIETIKAIRCCLHATTHHATVEIALSHNFIIDFLGRYRFHHLLVIALLNLAKLDIQLVTLL